jgi:hypothetical protein
VLLPNLTSFLFLAAFSKSSLVVFKDERTPAANYFFYSSIFSSSVFFSNGLPGKGTVLTFEKSISMLA